MKLILVIKLIFFVPLVFSQRDSSVVLPFLDKSKFPNVQKVYYQEKKWINGKIKKEGWIIEERPGQGASILRIQSESNIKILEHKIGIWKHYFFNGKIKAIDTINYKNGIRFGSQNYFRRDGTLEYRYVLKSKKKVGKLKGINKGKDLDDKMYSHTELYIYNREGVLTRKKIWEGEKLILDEKYDL